MHPPSFDVNWKDPNSYGVTSPSGSSFKTISRSHWLVQLKYTHRWNAAFCQHNHDCEEKHSLKIARVAHPLHQGYTVHLPVVTERGRWDEKPGVERIQVREGEKPTSGTTGKVKVHSYIATLPFTLLLQNSAVSNSQYCSKPLHITPWQTCSIEHHLGFSGKHSAIWQLIHDDYSYTNIHHCLQPGTHSYSWMNWSNVDWKKLAQHFTWQHRT